MNGFCKIQQSIDHLVTQKVLKLISNEIKLIFNNLNSSEMDLASEVFENLVMGALVGDQEILLTLALLFRVQSRNQIQFRPFSQIKLLEWMCRPNVKKILLNLIKKQLDNQQTHIQQHSIDNVEPPVQLKQAFNLRGTASPAVTIDFSQNQLDDQPFPNSESQIFSMNINEFHNEHLACGKVNKEMLIFTSQQIEKQIELQLEDSPHAQCRSLQLQQQIIEQNSKLLSNKQTDLNKLGNKIEQKQQKMQEQPSSEQNYNYALDSTLAYGHFLYGDKLQSIKRYFYFNQKCYLEVQWKRRINSTNYQPLSSIFQSSMLAYHCPQQLIKFYQERSARIHEL